MVSITLSIPEKTKELMNEFSEINWSGFVRKSIEEKVEELNWKEKMLEKLREEQELTSWSVKLGQKAKKGRFKKLKAKGLA